VRPVHGILKLRYFWAEFGHSAVVFVAKQRYLPARQLCSEQVMFLAAFVCVSVHTKSPELLVGNLSNLVGIWPMGNARSG